MVLYEGIIPCRCGGIGRRTGLKIPRRKSYGFDPRHRYHVRRSKHRSVSALRRKLHYVRSFFLSKSNPLRWASIWFPPESKHRSVSALRRKLHYVSSFFLSKSNPLRWASIWFPLRANTVPFPPYGENCTMLAPSSFPNQTRSAGLRFGSPLRANTVPFPPCGENCTMLAPSSFPNRTHFAGLRFGSRFFDNSTKFQKWRCQTWTG